MKKILVSILLIVIIVSFFGTINVYAESDKNIETYKLDLKILNNTSNIELYMLLPQNYITYAIQNGMLGISYNGSKTLKENNIPGINVNKDDVLDQTYKENDIEYVQIKLNSNNNEYTFDIIKSYEKMDMKYRIKQGTEDNIIHIDNFQVQDSVCNIEFDCSSQKITNVLKATAQQDFSLQPWQIVVVAVIIIIIAIVAKKMSK